MSEVMMKKELLIVLLKELYSETIKRFSPTGEVGQILTAGGWAYQPDAVLAQAVDTLLTMLEIGKQKQNNRIEAAPAVYILNDEVAISTSLFNSFDKAKKDCVGTFIKWPADWDDVRKVWYYEWKE